MEIIVFIPGGTGNMRQMRNIRGVLHCIAAIGLALSVLGGAAQAADYVVEYRAYNEALAGGDHAAAARHALAAWKAAEEALGDHKTTAVLAYNYGQLVLFENPEAALPALTRAKDLLEAGLVELPREDLNVSIAYAIFKVRGERKEFSEPLRAALVRRDESGAASTSNLQEFGLSWRRATLTQRISRRPMTPRCRRRRLLRRRRPTIIGRAHRPS